MAKEATGILWRADLTIELLDDKPEQADLIWPYDKSFLSFVSHALEDYHKTPLLGMANVYNPKAHGVWYQNLQETVTQWQKF